MARYKSVLVLALVCFLGCLPDNAVPMSDDSDSSHSPELIGDWYAVFNDDWTQFTVRSKSSSNATLQLVQENHAQDFNVLRDGDQFYLSLPFPSLEPRSRIETTYYLFLLKRSDDCYGVYPLRTDPLMEAIDQKRLRGTVWKDMDGVAHASLKEDKTKLVKFIKEDQVSLFYETPIALLTKTKPDFPPKPLPKRPREPSLPEVLLQLVFAIFQS